MNTVIVVSGMHRSGTSLVASILHKNDIHMGDRLLGKHPSQPFGHFEDVDFYRLNKDVISRAGGSWINPPSNRAILKQRNYFFDRATKLIQDRKLMRGMWGFKCPRTILLAQLYTEVLNRNGCKQKWIVTHRDWDKIELSLKNRGIPAQIDIRSLISRYYENKRFFCDQKKKDREEKKKSIEERTRRYRQAGYHNIGNDDCLTVIYEYLVDKHFSDLEMERLGKFVGVNLKNRGMIKYAENR